MAGHKPIRQLSTKAQSRATLYALAPGLKETAGKPPP